MTPRVVTLGGSFVVHRRSVTRRSAAVVVLLSLLGNALPPAIAGAAGPQIPGFDITLPTGSSISGSLENAEGDPLQGFGVSACPLLGSCDSGTETAADGTFEVRGLAPGIYNLAFAPLDASDYMEGYYSTTGPVAQIQDASQIDTTGGDVAGIEAVVARGFSISGTLSGPGSVPLAGVDVFASGQNDAAGATTDSGGAFVLRGLVDGQYSMSVRVPPTMNYLSGGVLAGEVVEDDFPGAAATIAGANVTGVDITTAAGFQLSGTLTGAGAAGAMVSAFGTHSTDQVNTAGSGAWSIKGMWPGTYQLVFSPETTTDFESLFPFGYWSGGATLTSNAAAAANISLTSSSIGGLNATIPNGLTMSGSVRSDAGVALEDAFVSICAPNAGCASTITGPSGAWQLDHLVPDQYVVSVGHGQHVGGYFGSGGWAADEAAAKRVTVASADVTGVNVVLPSGATLTGHVEGPLGEPVVGAMVNASGTGGIGPASPGGDLTDGDGAFELRGLTEDDYTVSVSTEQPTDYIRGYYADGAPGNYTADFDAASVIELFDAGIGASFTPIAPKRVLDSRIGTGLGGAFSANVPRTFQVAGLSPIPTDAVAVTGNVTVVGQTGAGYVSVTPTATANPTTSTINFPLGDTRANNFTVPLSDLGRLSAVYKSPGGRTAHLIVDITGYFVEGDSGNTYTPLTTKRVLDTRINTGLTGPLRANTPRTLSVAGANGVPANASAVTGNVTIVGQTRAGYVSVTLNPTTSPTTSTINFPAGDVRANGLTAPLNASGDLSIVYKASSGTAHVILDVTGYYLDDPSGLLYYPLPPGRIVDTRAGVLASELVGPFAANLPRTFAAIGRALIPLTAEALTGNLTIVNQTAGGYVSLTVSPTASPTTSTINFPPGDTRANGVTVPLSGPGGLSGVYKAPGGKTSHVILDVTGYFR